MSRTFRTHRITKQRERDTYHRNTHAARSCGHPTSCPYCLSNRTHSEKRKASLGMPTHLAPGQGSAEPLLVTEGD